jgi:hypothetical protein
MENAIDSIEQHEEQEVKVEATKMEFAEFQKQLESVLDGLKVDHARNL